MKIDHRIFVPGLCLIVLFIMGMQFAAWNGEDGRSAASAANSASGQTMPSFSASQLPSGGPTPIVPLAASDGIFDGGQALPAPPTDKSAPELPAPAQAARDISSVKPVLPENPAKPNADPDKPAASADTAPPENLPASKLYEVTAYFLNVRAEGNNKSAILRVVEQGTVLHAVETTVQGWLRLKDSGYVHGGYVKALAEEGKPAAEVRVLSAGLEPPKVVHRPDRQPAKPTSAVKSASGLTEAHIAEILEGSALAGEGLEQAIMEIEDEYGINAYFTIAVMKLESGHGKSAIARKKNNLFGLNALDGDALNKAFSFKTKGDSVRKFGQLIADHYIDKGYTSVEKVASKYCPANPDWAKLVTRIMKGDYKKL